MTTLSDIFDISYGNKFDLNKMIPSEHGENGINFVSRTAKNLGVVALVRKFNGIEPYPAGLITVALGGAILSSFVQQAPFYTAQNIAVLTPKKKMTLQEKIFYCMCIERNRFRYSTFGREANRTLKMLQIPDKPEAWANLVEFTERNLSEPELTADIQLVQRKWRAFHYEELFEIQKGKRITNSQMKLGTTPCIRPIKFNNGVYRYIEIEPNHSGNTITVSYNGSVGEAFYQPNPHFSLDDINVLYPKFKMNIYIAMFLVTLIKMERYRFSYGRKWHKERMEKSIINLPIDQHGNPDWEFMERFIKSLRYSKALEN